MIRRIRWAFAVALVALAAGAFVPQPAVAQSGRGAALVFTSSRDHPPRPEDGRERTTDLYVLQGGKVRRVTRVDRGTFLSFPTWSPDGTRIAAIRQRVGTENPPAPDVVIINAATGAMTSVPESRATSGAEGERVSLGAYPFGVDWAPDGDGLVFVTTADQAPFQTLHVKGNAIPVPEDVQYRYPTFTPKGDRLLVDRVPTADELKGDLGTLNLAGGDFTSFLPTDDPALAPETRVAAWYSPVMSPDSTRVVVTNLAGNNLEVYTTSEPHSRTTVDTRFFAESVAWTPSGKGVVTAAWGQITETSLEGGARALTPFVPYGPPDDQGIWLDVFGSGEIQAQDGVTENDNPDETPAREPGTAGSDSAPKSDDSDVIATAAHDSGRSVIAEGLRAPAELSGEAGLLLANALLAVGFVFVAFPAALFDNTFEDNYDEVRGWFRRRPRAERQPKPERGQLTRFVAFGLSALGAAALYIVLDPKARFDHSTVMLAIGLAAATVVSTLMSAAVSGAYLRKHGGEFGRLRAYPGALWVSAACVVISRAANFLPGYLYGSVGGFERDKEADRVHKGRSAALGIVAGAAIAAIAWVTWIPIRDAATDTNPSSVVLMLDALLASIAVLSFQSMLFSLIPVRGLPGAKLWSWNPKVWTAFMGVAAFGFFHLIIHPESEYKGSVVVMMSLFAAFAALSIAFWAYFRFRKPAKPA